MGVGGLGIVGFGWFCVCGCFWVGWDLLSGFWVFAGVRLVALSAWVCSGGLGLLCFLGF